MGRKIALFCKFWSVGWLVRFANVRNVRWLLFFYESAKTKFRTTDPIGFKMIPVQEVSVNHFESKLLRAVT